MQQLLTAPGELHTAAIGRITLTAQLAVDGGVTITVWAGTDRHAFIYTDLAIGRARYAQIRQLARTGMTAQQIADTVGADREHAMQAVRDILDDAMQSAAADNSPAGGRLVSALSAEVEAHETPAETAELAALAADVANTMRAARQDATSAGTFGADLTAARYAAVDDAVRAAEAVNRPATLDAYVGNPARVNAPRLATNTPSARKLTRPMLDMLAQADANGGRIRLDRRADRNRARAIRKRNNYLTLIYATDGVEASLYAAEITESGRLAVAEHRDTVQAVA
jgi:hypothetical protein